MRKLYFLIVIVFWSLQAFGQAELPIFNQRLTNTFIYNPSLAGYYGGNATLIHKQSKIVEGSNFSTNLIQVNTPIFGNNGGIGMKILMDEFGLTETFSGSLGASYHLNFGSIKRLSFGLSGDFYRTQLSDEFTSAVEMGDMSFANFESKTYYDFSFGFNYRSKFLDLGASINNLGSFVNIYDSTSQLNQHTLLYANFKIPVASGRDVIEPLITYRHLPSDFNELSDGRYDIGAYYTYNDMITIGGAFGGEGRFSAMAGFSFQNFYVGYNFDDIGGSNLLKNGSSSEFVIQYNFKRISNSDKFRERRISNPNIIQAKRKSFKSSTGKIRTQSKPKINTKSLTSNKSKKPNSSKSKYSGLNSKNLKSYKTVKKNRKMKNNSLKRKKGYMRQNKNRKKLF